MAAVTVFVDDAVRGDLPPLCVVTGRPTGDTLTLRHQIGGMPGALWFLLLLGPLGWVLLLLVSLSWRGETLNVTVPFHDDEFRRYHRARISQAGLVASGVAAFAVSFAFTGMGQQFVWLLVGIGCVVAATVVGVVARRRQPRVELDASRRWVTLWGVHPDFADSYRRTRSDSRESMSASDLSDR